MAGFAYLRAVLVGLAIALALVASPAVRSQDTGFAGPYNRAFKLLGAGHFADAIPFAEQAVRLAQNGSREDLARALIILANLRSILGQFDRSEPLYKRAIAIQEAALGPDHGDVANGLENLGRLYFEMGRYDEAGQIFRRAYTVAQKAYPTQRHVWTTHLKNIADVHRVQGRPNEAEPLLERAIAIWQEEYGDESPLLALPLAELAELYYSEKRLPEAEILLLRAVELHAAHFNQNHPNFARMLFTLASVQERQQASEAEATFKRALSLWQATLNNDHPFVVEALTRLAALYLHRGNASLALQYAKQATGIVAKRGARLATAGPAARNMVGLDNSAIFGLEIVALYEVGPNAKAADEAFLAAQRARLTITARALAAMAERYFQTSNDFATRIRERQDIERQWNATDKGLSGALGRGDIQSAATARSRLTALESRLTEIEREITRQFPAFRSVSGSTQLSLREVQSLLQPQEVLVQFIETREVGSIAPALFAWLISPDGAQWKKLRTTPEAVARKIAVLRCGLDAQQWDDPHSRSRCAKLTAGIPHPQQTLPFDLRSAHELFEDLLGPFKDNLKGKRLLLIPSETLASLPLGILATDQANDGLPNYAAVKWLAAQNPLAVLPAASSLQVLRRLTPASRAPQPFIGFGNPVLRGNANCASAPIPDKCPTLEQVPEIRVAQRRAVSRTPLAKLYGQRLANIDALRMQCPLPETAFELACVAQSLSAPTTNIYVGERATETTIKSLPLTSYKVIHFATHGLLAFETRQVSSTTIAEPALLLTPPAVATDADDGLLTASEITQLKLDADWIVLSACNTAGGESIDSVEALSGLARAFFYAGARALLVSHWAVDSNAAVQLTTRTFAELNRAPAQGRAEALQRSILALLGSRAAHQTHPGYWAPFSIVGLP